MAETARNSTENGLVTEPRTILYIEDDPASRRLVERTLKHTGYRVLLAERGLEGIDRARTELPDLVLTDINLPDISGYEIATALRGDKRFAKLPIVALTAQGYGEHQDIAAAAGITGYLAKPLDIAQLLERIEFYLAGGQDEVDFKKLPAAQVKYTQGVVYRLEARIRQLEEVNDALRKLDRMKENFIQITAHELRTPLTLIFGYSRLLEDYAPIKEMMHYDPNIATMVEGLAESIARMHRVIDEIMIVSRIMTDQIDLSLSPLNLASVVQKIIESYHEILAERRLTIHFESAQWPTNMKADVDMIRLTVDNLIGNAIKYTPDGGNIYLEAKTGLSLVTFSIRDTGVGIDPAEQPKIFEQFHTVNDAEFHSTSKTAFGGGGIGLGLSICKGIIEAHGGTIKVSSPGYNPQTYPGSEFTVVLPLTTRRNVRQ